MSTQIDPLTGLPMVFDSIIEQIPLDAQIFPYADLGATARPTAPPLYPDSIIPVSAFLSGQHPDTGSAQTVETDGHHALKVALAGGGGSVIWENTNDLTLQDERESSFGLDDMWTILAADAIGVYYAGLVASVEIDWQTPPPASGHTHFHFYYDFGGSGFNPWLLHGNISYGIPSTGYGNTTWHGVHIPPVPLALFNDQEPNHDVHFVYVSDGTVDLRVTSTFTLIKHHG